MQQLLLLFLCLAALQLPAQVVLEDFEGGEADLNWQAYEGTFTGAIENPFDTLQNTSAFVGSYTKAEGVPFSAFIAELGEETLDLSENNRFQIQIYAGEATQLLMKLEDSTDVTKNIERRVNIATPDVWRTYSFDFSDAADIESLNRIILFFDPGVAASSGTYLFDNLIAFPAGPCAGTAVDPLVIDDFECQRNATYGVPGFDDIEVIVNPDKSGINTSDSVGQYTDRAGGFHALVIDYNDPIDLSVNNQVCMKVWAPVAGPLLVKLEGGSSPPAEREVMISETMSWVEVCANFSDQAAANHERLVFFFNVREDDADGDIYYIDDLTYGPAPAVEALEDFEGGAKLTWGALNDNSEQNGTFNGAIDNPDTEGNDSETVGSYTRGTSRFSTLTAALPAGIDLSDNPQLNLDVWAPEANTTVTLQLVSAADGPKSAEATTGAAMSWATLNFNFEEFAELTDFDRINIIFAPETTGTGTYYYDNLVQGLSTVDPCVDVAPDPSVLDDFECQRNANYTGGAEFLTAIDNPDAGEDSPNRSTRVGQFEDQPGQFNALVIDYGAAIDLSLRNQFSATVWSPIEGQLLFKLEGGTAAPIERTVEIDTTEAWSTYTVDFSDAVDGGYTTLVLFFGTDAANETVNTYFIDDLGFSRAPYANSCVVTFETADFSLTNWRYFANGALEGNAFMTIANPDTTGINKSATVGVFEEAADGETFAGMFADLEAPLTLTNGSKVVTMKLWMEVAGSVAFKLELPRDGAPASGDVLADYTTPGEWQELTFDMSALPDGAQYDRITLIPNNTAVPEGEALTHYFDDIAVGDGDCANLVSLFNPVRVASLQVYPNPMQDLLIIDNPLGAVRFTLTNMLGQQVQQLTVTQGAGPQVRWNVGEVPAGTYVLTGQDRGGRLLARSVVVKR